jgi:hypothetical protein
MTDPTIAMPAPFPADETSMGASPLLSGARGVKPESEMKQMRTGEGGFDSHSFVGPAVRKTDGARVRGAKRASANDDIEITHPDNGGKEPQ